MNSKYTADNMIPAFRIAAAARNEMQKVGCPDNGGAIDSAERILEIFGMRLNYPGLNHFSHLRHHDRAEFSHAAFEAHRQGKRVEVEHVSPRRNFTRGAIDLAAGGASDEDLITYVRQNYQLVLLTAAERKGLDKGNRSRMTPTRLADAGLEVRTAEEWISQE